jgi:hypothetical protein
VPGAATDEGHAKEVAREVPEAEVGLAATSPPCHRAYVIWPSVPGD